MNLQESIRKDLDRLNEAPLELSSNPDMDYSRMKENIMQCDILIMNNNIYRCGDVQITQEEMDEWGLEEPSVELVDDCTDDLFHISLKDIQANPKNYEFFTIIKKEIV